MEERFAEIRRLLAGVNKRYLLFALLIVLIFTGLSVARCSEVHPASESEQLNQTFQAEDAVLSEQQQALYDSYDQETRSFLDYLSANAWLAGNDEKVLRFTDKGFTEMSGGQTHEASFAVSALEENTSTESGVNGESTTVTTYSVALLMDEGTSLLTLRKFNDNNAGQQTSSVTSSAFTMSESYVLGEAAGGVSVTGLSSAFDNQIDGKSSDMVKSLQDYCASHYPTATTAAWGSVASLDYKNGTVSTSFSLDNDAKTIVTAIYYTGSQTFEIS